MIAIKKELARKRCGELLEQVESMRGAHLKRTQRGAAGGPYLNGRMAAGKTAGLSHRQTKTALRVANVSKGCE